VAVKYVPSEDLLDAGDGGIGVRELDRGPETCDGCPRFLCGRARAQIGTQMSGDLGLEDRPRPSRN
jgi:hypothetical protein